MVWNADNPAVANQVIADIADIEENFAVLGPRVNIWIPAKDWIPTSTNGCAALATTELATNDKMIGYLAFAGASADENATHSLMLSENWNRSTIKAKFFFIPATGCTAEDTVHFAIGGVAVSHDDAIDAAAGTFISCQASITAGVDADLHVTPATAAVTLGGTPALTDYVHLKIIRMQSTDSMAEDAWLLGVMLQITLSNEVAAW